VENDFLKIEEPRCLLPTGSAAPVIGIANRIWVAGTSIIQIVIGVEHSEGRSALEHGNTFDLPPARDFGRNAVVQEPLAFAEWQRIDVVEGETVAVIDIR